MPLMVNATPGSTRAPRIRPPVLLHRPPYSCRRAGYDSGACGAGQGDQSNADSALRLRTDHIGGNGSTNLELRGEWHSTAMALLLLAPDLREVPDAVRTGLHAGGHVGLNDGANRRPRPRRSQPPRPVRAAPEDQGDGQTSTSSRSSTRTTASRPPFCFVQQAPDEAEGGHRLLNTDAARARWRSCASSARQAFDPTARYDVTTPDGVKVGENPEGLRQEPAAVDLPALRNAAGNEVAIVTEKNAVVALIRRLVGFIPYLGDFADFLPIPYDFVFLRGEEELRHPQPHALEAAQTPTRST